MLSFEGKYVPQKYGFVPSFFSHTMKAKGGSEELMYGLIAWAAEAEVKISASLSKFYSPLKYGST